MDLLKTSSLYKQMLMFQENFWNNPIDTWKCWDDFHSNRHLKYFLLNSLPSCKLKVDFFYLSIQVPTRFVGKRESVSVFFLFSRSEWQQSGADGNGGNTRFSRTALCGGLIGDLTKTTPAWHSPEKHAGPRVNIPLLPSSHLVSVSPWEQNDPPDTLGGQSCLAFR